MRVLLANWLSTRGGEEKHVIDLARYLCRQPEIEVTLAAPLNTPWETEIDRLTGLHRIEVPFRTKFDLVSIVSLMRLFRWEHFDVVHVHGARAGWLLRFAAILARFPRVVWSMHLLISDHVSRQPRWSRPFYGIVERFLNRRTALIVAVSHDLKRNLLLSDPQLDPARVVAIPNGIEEPPFAESAAIGSGKASALICLSIGKLQPEKGHDILIEAVFLLPPELRPTVLIVGEGYLRPRLEERISALSLQESVHLMGFRKDIPALLRSADFYVMPSRYEGLPIALLEAMALAKPIIATAVNGIPEAIKNGVSGLLVPPEDAQALADAIRCISENRGRRKALGAGARAAYLSGFTHDHCFGQIREAYALLAA